MEGASSIQMFETMTRNTTQVQLSTLQSILRHNADAEYLLQHGLNGRSDVSSFKSCIPIVCHADIKHHIERIADGDKSPILTHDSITQFALSSGTTDGNHKLVPFTKEFYESALKVYRISAAFRARDFPIRPYGRMIEFVYCGQQFKTNGGIHVATGTTNYFKSDAFKQKQVSTKVYACSPDEVIFCTDCYQATYCHLLCGVLHLEEVEFITSTFVYSIIEAFKLFENVWQDLVNDIEHGEINDKILDPNLRHSMSKKLCSNPKLANKIRKECESNPTFQGVIKHIWPNVKYIYSIMTGTMESYLSKMRHYAGDIPLIGADYGASEGWIAINVNPKTPPEDVTFTLVPDLGFFEFIPMDDNKMSKIVDAYDVVVGKEYEIVLTTFGGLYRYRLGDVVRITGFYNTTPQFSYQCRKDVVLNIHIDKNGERDIEMVMKKVSTLIQISGSELIDYTTYADLSTNPAHYTIFWELKDGDFYSSSILQECCDLMDKSFIEPGYALSRASGTIGPLQLHILKAGTFKQMLDSCVNTGKITLSQYKIPRCIRAPFTLEILEENTCTKYLSQYKPI